MYVERLKQITHGKETAYSVDRITYGKEKVYAEIELHVVGRKQDGL